MYIDRRADRQERREGGRYRQVDRDDEDDGGGGGGASKQEEEKGGNSCWLVVVVVVVPVRLYGSNSSSFALLI